VSFSPPDQPSAGQPSAPADYPWPIGYPAPHSYGAGPVAPVERRRGKGREALVALVAAGVIAALGFPLGWLWSTLAPHAPAVITSDGPAYARPDQEQLVGAEGWYVFLAAGTGIVLAVLAWFVLRRYRGVAVLLALGVGGVGTGVLAYWTGHQIGLSHARNLVKNAPVGTHFALPVNLRVQQVGLWHHWLPYARGDVLLLAIVAVLVYVLLAGFSPYPALRAPRVEDFNSDY